MNTTECNRNCWIAAGIAGALVLLFTWGAGDLSFWAGLFLGLITSALLGSLLVWLACNDRPELFNASAGQTGTDWTREAVESQPEELLVSGALGPVPAPLAAQVPIVAGAMPAEKQASKQAPAPKADAAKDAKSGAAPKKQAAAKKDRAKPADKKPTKADTKKEAAAPDDLKRIKGIGPKLSDWLHENGISRYEQIAAWDADAVADFAERLGRMGGRIEADDWVGQARQLAEGRETEFAQRVDDGEVY